LGQGVDGLRIGIARDPFWLGASDDVVGACEAALDLLQSQGATVTTMDLPQLANMPPWMSIMHSEAAAYHAGRFAQAPERFGADVRERVASGVRARASEYINDQRLRRLLIEEMREAMQHVDVMISPTTPVTAPVIDFDELHFELRDLTWRHAVLGIPTISVPCGFDGEGLPIGLSIAGRNFDEVTVLRVAQAYEQATEWHTRRPVVAQG
jgi:aspartyl-tRNA(Asn)/glutamyl-tRNA(Gln) amidotransferase subunit A